MIDLHEIAGLAQNEMIHFKVWYRDVKEAIEELPQIYSGDYEQCVMYMNNKMYLAIIKATNSGIPCNGRLALYSRMIEILLCRSYCEKYKKSVDKQSSI